MEKSDNQNRIIAIKQGGIGKKSVKAVIANGIEDAKNYLNSRYDTLVGALSDGENFSGMFLTENKYIFQYGNFAFWEIAEIISD